MSGPLVIASRFCGPPASGNGGYVAGRAAAAGGTHGCHPGVRVVHDGILVAEAVPAAADPAIERPGPVPVHEAP